MKNDPAAFPTMGWEQEQPSRNWRPVVNGGLTKRELFAAMAMQGLASNGDAMQAMAKKGILEWDIVADAVRMADSLLAELEKK